jgi:parvulin-like peptidyl-prolyl isomerase
MMALVSRFRLPALVAGALVASTLLWLTPVHAQPAPRGKVGKAGKAGKHAGKGLVVDRVVAVVNDAIILESELAGRISPLTQELRSIADERERARRLGKLTTQMLDEMIAEELIVQAARASKIEVEAKEVTAAVDEIKKQNSLDDAGLEQALAMQGMSISSYKKDVERQIMRMRAVNMLVRPKVTVTDEDVRARYDEMNRRSAAVSGIHLKHILIGMPANPSEKQIAEGKARAAALIEQARGGAPFDKLAQDHSDDEATAEGGGDLGWIERGSLPTEWEVVVFSMDKGEVRGPISGPTGFHIFFVEDQKKSDIKPFEEQKETLRNELYSREMEKQTVVWLEELRKKAHISRKL